MMFTLTIARAKTNRQFLCDTLAERGLARAWRSVKQDDAIEGDQIRIDSLIREE